MGKSLTERIKQAGCGVAQKQVDLVKTAATLEGARIIAEQITTLAKAKAPMMLRGYIDTPYGKALLMNAALMAVEVGFPDLPEDHPYKQIANAAVVTTYQEFIQGFNLQDMVAQLFSGEKMAGLLKTISKAEEA
jgi:hypothetical protein